MAGNRKSRKLNEPTTLNNVVLLRAGQPFFDELLVMINEATESLHLQTYIFDDDDTGQMIVRALKEAVLRKVNVFLLADGYASKNLTVAFIRDLEESGVHFRFFNPLFKSNNFYLGRRLHHKLVVADARVAMVGGINIADKYNDIHGHTAWLDFAVRIEGEAARELCILAFKTWNNFPASLGVTPCEKTVLPPNPVPPPLARLSIRRNDWVRRKNEVSSTYVQLCRSAKSDITILCSYFLPGRIIRKQLALAASRGVKVRVVTTGVSDVPLSKYAERFLYEWLLRKKIALYEYQPSVLHGKLAICDGEWTTIGSYNINNISAYASIELNVNIYDQAFAMSTEKVVQQIIEKDCIDISADYHKRTFNPLRKFLQWFSYVFIRLLFYLFTFYYKHRK